MPATPPNCSAKPPKSERAGFAAGLGPGPGEVRLEVLTLDRGYRVTRVDRNPSFVDHPSAGSLLAAPPLRDLLSPAA
jgi:hypothetical protein